MLEEPGEEVVGVEGVAPPLSGPFVAVVDDRSVELEVFNGAILHGAMQLMDKGGDEDFHAYVIDPAEKLVEGQDVPQARDVTPIEGIQARFYSFPEKTPDIIYIGLNDRDERYHEKLATPDVTIADLIGDLDPIKAASRKLALDDPEAVWFTVVGVVALAGWRIGGWRLAQGVAF